MRRSFLDTNVLLYAIETSGSKQEMALSLLERGGIISVQSLNEFANVLSRKRAWDWPAINDALTQLRSLASEIVILDVALHELGMALLGRYNFSVYNAMIVSAACVANCDVLYSEDMHHGLIVDGRLTIENPFLSR